ncbi:DUF2306 domain-containing protein [Marilutibacter alkalisoli]|nr:DUF2306 domain-containing protein [Lysobacter alkalisoli]
MNAYGLLFATHVAAGTVALLTFWSAALLRKGSQPHRLVGRAYLLAMVCVIATALPMCVVQYQRGQPVTAAFLAYLVVITSTAVWSAWRAVRDKHDVVRYTGPVFVVLGVLSLLTGAAVLALGVRVNSPLLMGFSSIGLVAGIDTLLKRIRREKMAARPGWWRTEHYTSMLGNGIATHIAFLGIGLPRLLPSLGGSSLQYLAWFGPLLVAVLAKLWLDRRWKPGPARPTGRAMDSLQRSA